MAKPTLNQFNPDYAVPPGETLAETLAAVGMSQGNLAVRTGRPVKTISEIINGKAAITPDTAIQFERVLGIPAGFWNNLERNYQAAQAHARESEQLQDYVEWANQFPASVMLKHRWLNVWTTPVEKVKELLNFFGVVSPAQWTKVWQSTVVNYRKSTAFKSDAPATAAWLRKGEIEAQQIQCQSFDKARFVKALEQARNLTIEGPAVFEPRLRELCSAVGVAVVFIPDLPRTRVSGATRWLGEDKALIQLGLRYKTNDHLWFTFFHEAGHILLHGKRDFFLENDGEQDAAKETEANRFAADCLISPNDLREALRHGVPYSKEWINQFAQRLGIAPGIVVGRLQHDGHVPRSHCNDLKVKLTWNI